MSKICAACPMNDERYEPTNEADRREKEMYRQSIERFRDFIGWIFDNPDDEGIHWMSEGEAWDLFEKWEDKKNEPTDKQIERLLEQ